MPLHPAVPSLYRPYVLSHDSHIILPHQDTEIMNGNVLQQTTAHILLWEYAIVYTILRNWILKYVAMLIWRFQLISFTSKRVSYTMNPSHSDGLLVSVHPPIYFI
jgi:hypothetical protein